ncbi:MAG: HAD-IIIA family hydrolase [Candidatus Heimdallarchaeota archaeon]|nr:MAG: HAD-IIIA family hydrolase [Candidatus Heimdallarchaeota archaeon]
MALKAILFDLDGTLVNTLRLFPQLIAQEFMEIPTRRKVKKYLKRLGTFYNLRRNGGWYKHSWFSFQLFRGIKADFRISWVRLLQGLLRITWQFLKWDQEIHVFPKVPETLQKLKQRGFKLAIVSNGSPRLLRKRFAPFLHYFDVLVDSKSIGYWKPSPIPIYYAIKKLGVSIDEVVFVGDTIVDLLAAKRSGVRIILVKTGVFGLPSLTEVDYQPVAVIPIVGKNILDLTLTL